MLICLPVGYHWEPDGTKIVMVWYEWPTSVCAQPPQEINPQSGLLVTIKAGLQWWMFRRNWIDVLTLRWKNTTNVSQNLLLHFLFAGYMWMAKWKRRKILANERAKVKGRLKWPLSLQMSTYCSLFKKSMQRSLRGFILKYQSCFTRLCKEKKKKHQSSWIKGKQLVLKCSHPVIKASVRGGDTSSYTRSRLSRVVKDRISTA